MLLRDVETDATITNTSWREEESVCEPTDEMRHLNQCFHNYGSGVVVLNAPVEKKGIVWQQRSSLWFPAPWENTL